MIKTIDMMKKSFKLNHQLLVLITLIISVVINGCSKETSSTTHYDLSKKSDETIVNSTSSNDRICGVQKGYTKEVLPIFKSLIDKFKQDVPNFLKQEITSKEQFTQMVLNIKHESENIYLFTPKQQSQKISVIEFIDCMDQYFKDERSRRLDEYKDSPPDIKKILDKYIQKIDDNIELFLNFKRAEKDIRVEIEKLNHLLNVKEDWLSKTTITHHDLLESVAQQFRIDMMKMLEIDTHKLNKFPDFE
jgi:hypothetical protein